jgi:hypothetical protein
MRLRQPVRLLSEDLQDQVILTIQPLQEGYIVHMLTQSFLENALHGGFTLSFTAQLRKAFTNGFEGMIAYTYTSASDLTANPGSTAGSTWSGNPTSGHTEYTGIRTISFCHSSQSCCNIVLP